MSGGLWTIWNLPDASAPPACLAHGRNADQGLSVFWQLAFEDAHRANRVAIDADMRPRFLLLPAWNEQAGVDLFRRWAADNPKLFLALGSLHWNLTKHDTVNWGEGSAAFVEALFAHVRAADSASDFIARVASPASTGLPTDDRARVRCRELSPPRPIVEIIRSASSEADLAFRWPERLVARLPAHARLVGKEHRSPGMPPRGSIFWETPGGDGWIVIGRPELDELEAAAGRTYSVLSHTPVNFAAETAGIHGSAIARFNSFPGTYRSRPITFDLDGIEITIDIWGRKPPTSTLSQAELAALGIR